MESQGSYFDDARFITGVLDPRGFVAFCTQQSKSSLVLDPKLLLECAVQRASDFAISLGDEQRSLFIRKHIVVEMPPSLTHNNPHCTSPILRILVCPNGNLNLVSVHLVHNYVWM